MSYLISTRDKKMDLLEAIGEFVEINDHKIHVYRTGNSDKPKLVLMSGSSTVAPVYDFKILYTKLQESFRIIIVEKFGYGYSDICEYDCDIDSLVNLQREALEKLGEKGPYILMPHSMSGIEAIRWIQMYPEEVNALIGLDMTSYISYAEWTDSDIEKKSRLLRRMKKLGLYRLSTIPHNDSLTQKDKKQLKLLQKRNAFNECYKREAERVLENAATVKNNGPIKCPTLLFSSNGKQTFRNWIQNQHEFAEVMDAKLITYDCGHYIHYFKSEEMSKEIKDFIASLPFR